MSQFVQDVSPGVALIAGERQDQEGCPAVWVLGHSGYSGMGRLDLWAYPTETDACREGAKMALVVLEGHEFVEAQRLFDAGEYRRVMPLFEEHMPGSHLLRVEPAFFTEPSENDGTAPPPPPHV